MRGDRWWHVSGILRKRSAEAFSACMESVILTTSSDRITFGADTPPRECGQALRL